MEIAANGALARGETELAGELFGRMVNLSRERELSARSYGRVGLAMQTSPCIEVRIAPTPSDI